MLICGLLFNCAFTYIYVLSYNIYFIYIYIHIGSLIDDADDAAGGDCNSCI